MSGSKVEDRKLKANSVVVTAASTGNGKLLKRLLDAKALPNTYIGSYAGKQCSAVSQAARHGQTECIKLLLNARADILGRHDLALGPHRPDVSHSPILFSVSDIF